MNDEKMTASEAVFGFAAWLSGLPESATFGAKEESSTIAELAGKWCSANNLPKPRENVYPNNLSKVDYDLSLFSERVKILG